MRPYEILAEPEPLSPFWGFPEQIINIYNLFF